MVIVVADSEVVLEDTDGAAVATVADKVIVTGII